MHRTRFIPERGQQCQRPLGPTEWRGHSPVLNNRPRWHWHADVNRTTFVDTRARGSAHAEGNDCVTKWTTNNYWTLRATHQVDQDRVLEAILDGPTVRQAQPRACGLATGSTLRVVSTPSRSNRVAWSLSDVAPGPLPLRWIGDRSDFAPGPFLPRWVGDRSDFAPRPFPLRWVGPTACGWWTPQSSRRGIKVVQASEPTRHSSWTPQLRVLDRLVVRHGRRGSKRLCCPDKAAVAGKRRLWEA